MNVTKSSVYYGQWKHSCQWKHFLKIVHCAFRNHGIINLLIRRGWASYCTIIGSIQLLAQNKLIEIQFLKKQLFSYQQKLIFWLVETISFFHFQTLTPATDSFICPSGRNVYLNECCIPVSGNGFFGQRKPFFIYLLDIPASENFLSSKGNVFLKRIFYSG